MTTFEDGLGTGPKSSQKLRRPRSAPGPVVPRGARFLECYRVQEGAR